MLLVCDGDNMDYLYNLDLNENEILDIIDANDDVKNLSEEEMIKYIYVLVSIGCSQEQIHNIITSNPLYFSRDILDVSRFLERLASFDDIDLCSAIENNPWLLNKDSFELDEYISERNGLGISKKEILDKFIIDCY